MELLVDRSLPIPEIFGSKPFIGKFYLLSTVYFFANIVFILKRYMLHYVHTHIYPWPPKYDGQGLSTVYRWYENKEKEAGNGSIFTNIRIDICLQCLRHIGIVFWQVFDSNTVEYFINSFICIVVFYLLRTKEKMGRRNQMKNGKIKYSYLVKVHFQQFSSTHI